MKLHLKMPGDVNFPYYRQYINHTTGDMSDGAGGWVEEEGGGVIFCYSILLDILSEMRLNSLGQFCHW